MFVTGENTQAFKWKFEIWKTSVCHYEFYTFPIFEDFSDNIGSNFNKWKLKNIVQ